MIRPAVTLETSSEPLSVLPVRSIGENTLDGRTNSPGGAFPARQTDSRTRLHHSLGVIGLIPDQRYEDQWNTVRKRAENGSASCDANYDIGARKEIGVGNPFSHSDVRREVACI
jgi:hypothetical protein